MESSKRRSDIPVLLLHDIDPQWELHEQEAAYQSSQVLINELQNEGHSIIDIPVTHHYLDTLLKSYNPNEYIIFNWCEGLPGVSHSEHVVAQILEEHNFVYTGSSPEVLFIGWNKAAIKSLLKSKNIPTPDGTLINNTKSINWYRFPAIVKPAYEHCSLGITHDSVVINQIELFERIHYILNNFKQPALVEDFIDGREFHVTLWGNGVIHALPPAEMDFSAFSNIKDRVCTYNSKFTLGSDHYEKIVCEVPASLDDIQLELLNNTAIQAYKALGCRDYARLDVRLKDDVFYILDINPNPDFSPDTSTVYAAQSAGLSYGALASCIVNLATLRHPVYSSLI
ncbi:MAG: D-alanine--D-alanine ligase family protein [Spirochaetota bacterium]